MVFGFLAVHSAAMMMEWWPRAGGAYRQRLQTSGERNGEGSGENEEAFHIDPISNYSDLSCFLASSLTWSGETVCWSPRGSLGAPVLTITTVFKYRINTVSEPKRFPYHRPAYSSGSALHFYMFPFSSCRSVAFKQQKEKEHA
ncbi:hypothetical protein BaRGS_00022562 [Batillaria attramentaria]|uniref:Uncharacterized protein n=1 Tax=Batillaria attramentaria TaxID=370345 RepID=A0ABD0KGM6_9CAEN